MVQNCEVSVEGTLAEPCLSPSKEEPRNLQKQQSQQETTGEQRTKAGGEKEVGRRESLPSLCRWFMRPVRGGTTVGCG